MAESLFVTVGRAAWEACNPPPLPSEAVLAAFGKLIVHSLRERNIYINPGRGDPSGRW